MRSHILLKYYIIWGFLSVSFMVVQPYQLYKIPIIFNVLKENLHRNWLAYLKYNLGKCSQTCSTNPFFIKNFMFCAPTCFDKFQMAEKCANTYTNLSDSLQHKPFGWVCDHAVLLYQNINRRKYREGQHISFLKLPIYRGTWTIYIKAYKLLGLNITFNEFHFEYSRKSHYPTKQFTRSTAKLFRSCPLE